MFCLSRELIGTDKKHLSRINYLSQGLEMLFLRLIKNAPAFAEAASRRQADAS
jgi:hypothetical protein